MIVNGSYFKLYVSKLNIRCRCWGLSFSGLRNILSPFSGATSTIS